MKKIYILSDVHLGSWAIEHRRTHERRIVSFLDKIKDEAAAVYLLGDVFDFWYEHRYVVPKGFTRFLGKVSELTDKVFYIWYWVCFNAALSIHATLSFPHCVHNLFAMPVSLLLPCK